MKLDMNLTAKLGSDATSEMEVWWREREREISLAIAERVVPKVTQLILMELDHLGFNKMFPRTNG